MDEAQFLQFVRSIADIASALRRLREIQQLTLQDVSDLAGVSRAYITRLEHGERQPERDTLIALLLAAYSLPVNQANRLLLLAGFAPMHHRLLEKSI